jgi:hypothetical protein
MSELTTEQTYEEQREQEEIEQESNPDGDVM